MKRKSTIVNAFYQDCAEKFASTPQFPLPSMPKVSIAFSIQAFYLV
jgi:hypothetical protein